jgi:steroid delta-isomerase
MSESEARAHVDSFNAAVTSGDWTGFTARFHPDAVMTFEGPPVGPFIGRDAITAGYATAPPDDTLEICSVQSGPDAELVRFRWSRGGTGTMTIRRRGGLIASLTVTFD